MLHGDGTQRRDFTFVTDVVEATVRAAEVDVAHAVFNVGSGSDASLLEVLSLISEVMARPVQVITCPALMGESTATSADLTHAREQLGYLPRVGLGEGIAAQLTWQKSLALGAVRT
jgi:nucleoside-diphosphate-sugar epimerase